MDRCLWDAAFQSSVCDAAKLSTCLQETERKVCTAACFLVLKLTTATLNTILLHPQSGWWDTDPWHGFQWGNTEVRIGKKGILLPV